ncbi:hypothetical protein K449DRAFT_184037 [Hypoxylon sp. EC38]|nr:hypothetical protein K449DRAFT_184037 [Hypoxylon sp. EC38]
MAHLPEGWESDYDGSRWFYRYTSTGLTQYHFPRPGDEFPELIGLGFGPLGLPPQKKHVGEHEVEKQGAPNGQNSGVPEKKGEDGKKTARSANEGENMSATGYFDPDNFLCFGFNDVSPAGDGNNTAVGGNEPLLAELPEESVQSPVGFVAELASSETAKCAEELAPIELDATQIAPAALNTNVQHNGPTELPTHRSPIEQKQSVQYPTHDMQPVDEYPLVSASFAYPPLKASNKPVENGVQGPTSSHTEQKVLASQRPADDQTEQNKYETWKPTQDSINDEVKNPNRQSMALSSISVLQSQNSELGPMEQKRHSLSGPAESSGANTDLPGILRQPSDPRKSTAVSTPSPKVEPSPIPAVLQPAIAPSETSSPQKNSQQQSGQSKAPPLPGSGARHESISLGSGSFVTVSNSPPVPFMVKPAQSPSIPGAQFPIQAEANEVHPGSHRVNTLPNQLSSHTPSPSPPKLGGPGIYIFQEITAAPISAAGQVQNKPQDSVVAKPSSSGQDTSLHRPQQFTVQSHSIMNEPLPVIAPLSVSKPPTPTSPDKASANFGSPGGSIPSNPQYSSVPSPQGFTQHPAAPRPSVQNSPHAGSSQTQGSSGRISTTSQGPSTHLPQVNHSTLSQGPTRTSSIVQHKLLRKPVLPQRPNKVIPIFETVLVGSASVPIQHYHPPHLHGISLSMVSNTSNLGFQEQTHQIFSQASSASPLMPIGQQSQANNQRPPSVLGSSPHLSPGAYVQGQQPTTNTSNSQIPIRGSNHAVAATIQISGGISLAGKISNHPQPSAPNPQNAVQRPPSNPNQRPPSTQPMTHPLGSSQSAPAGIAQGQDKLYSSPSPMTHSVSPLQSQVSSPTASIASLHRPPSSASSHSHVTSQGILTQNRPPTSVTHQNSPPAPRPTMAQTHQAQGSSQNAQSPKPPVTGAPKPFPMLPGQVKPLPSQVGSPPIPIQAQPVHAAPVQTQYQQNQMGPANPPQQHQGNQQTTQVLAHRPPQQQNVQGHHTHLPSNSTPGQPMTGTVQQGHPRPPVHSISAQQNTPVHSHPNVQNPGQHMNQDVGQFNQSHNGHTVANLPQGAHAQPQVSQMTQHHNAANLGTSATQQFSNGQTMGQGQQQQFAQASGTPYNLPQTVGQGKPFDSAQAAAALSDAGKKMKKWAKKTWKNNPALKQTTAAVGGAIIAGSLGGNEVAGAALASKIYNTSQGTPQNGQPQRPPGPQHAHTAPPQAQHLPGTNAAFQNIQAINRPQLQQGIQQQNIPQPIGVQTPGRPPVVQNPGMIAAAANNNAQQQPGQQPGMMNQRPPNQILRPPVARPPVPQMQQPAAFNQPVYQAAPNRPVYQALQNQPQPLYQMRPNQPTYQVPPGQSPYQTQGGPDPYAAIGATIGGAINALANSNGGKPDAGPPAGSQQQHHANNPEPQHETYPAQHNTGQSEQYEPQSEPHHETYSEQHHQGQSEQNHEPYYEQSHATYSEQHQEAHAQSHQEAYAEQSHTGHSEQNTTCEEDRQPQSEQYEGAYSEPPPAETQFVTENSTSESYYAPQSDTTIINNTIINNVDNTAIAQSSQMTYMENTNTVDTTNTNMETTSFVGPSYADTMTTNAEASAFTEATYTGTDYADITGVNSETAAYAETGYVDASNTDAIYVDATYADTTVVEEGGVDMSMSMDETAYMGDQTSMMTMEESMSFDASASYMETSTIDYSGGDWGGGEW